MCGGLTTAASIWLTAAIGILFGIGFYFPAVLATGCALGILAVFRWFEARMPAQMYAYHYIRFQRHNTMAEKELRDLLSQHGFSIANMAYRVIEDGQVFEYRMVIRTTDPANTSRLADELRQLDLVREFRILRPGISLAGVVAGRLIPTHHAPILGRASSRMAGEETRCDQAHQRSKG